MDKKYINNFTGLYFMGHRDNSDYDKANIVVLPVGYQGTCSWMKGTKNGPKSIINASYTVEPFDEEAMLSLEEVGIHTLIAQNFPDKTKSKKVSNTVEKIFTQILEDNKFPVLLGGEHSLTIGAVESLCKKYPNLSMLQIDAHTDLDEAFQYEKYHHAAMASTLIGKTNISITQVGIRSVIPEHLDFAKQHNIPIFLAHDIISRKHKIADIVNTLKKDVYITIDIDGFDPSIFPNTGTPEPNGLKWQYVINLITEVAKTKNIVGLDLVEHASENPRKPHFSDYSAAKLLHKVLCIIWKNKN